MKSTINRKDNSQWKRCIKAAFTTVNSLGFIFLFWSTQAIAAQTCQTATAVTASTPTAGFIDNADGTVTHAKTGLMWKRCAEGQSWSGTACTGTAATYTWQGALQQAKALNTAGGFALFSDWRVPNLKELNLIVEEQCMTPAINAAIFPSTVSSPFWSASPYGGNTTHAWLVNFNDGSDSVLNKTVSASVRLVRGGS